HPNWEQILAGDEMYHSSLQVTIDEQEKLGVPELYCGNPITSKAKDSMRQSHQLPTTRKLQAESPQRIQIIQNTHAERYIVPPLTYTTNTTDYILQHNMSNHPDPLKPSTHHQLSSHNIYPSFLLHTTTLLFNYKW
ncbi:hypothetical protein BDQ17DRAFT_1261844, partial [Cyathus striatus]